MFSSNHPTTERQDMNTEEEFASLDETPQAVQEPQVPEPAEVEELPEKYRGKTPAEIAKMHAEAEKLISRQAQEVGEVRKLADQLIKERLDSKAAQPAVVEEPDVDFFENPKEAIKRTLESSSEMKELRELKQRIKAQETAAALAKEHPDAFEITKSSDFADWVKASKVRLSLYAQADSDFDFDAANELLTSYKAQRNISKASVANTEASNKKALNAAKVDTNGSNEGSSKKFYRRADIMRLMTENPDRYMALQNEIMAAYAEGRVR